MDRRQMGQCNPGEGERGNPEQSGQDVESEYKLWRVHDKLYDLGGFIHQHPGGSHWLTITRGLDITELYEKSHVKNLVEVEANLAKHFVRGAPKPRNSPHTFEQDGLYLMLKSLIETGIKVYGSEPTIDFRLRQDALVCGFAILSVIGLLQESYCWMVAAGLFLGWSTASAQNFLTIKDNWRKYYLDLSLYSHSEWQEGHVKSSLGVPSNSHFLKLYGRNYPWLLQQLIYSQAFPFQFIARILGICMGRQTLRKENFFPVLQLLGFLWYCETDTKTAFLYWYLMHSICSYWVLSGSKNPGVLHGACSHPGDPALVKTDFGICKLGGTPIYVKGSEHRLFRVPTPITFSSLRHLYPTVCDSKLKYIKPIVEDTITEFQARQHKKVYGTLEKHSAELRQQVFAKRIFLGGKG